mmetsp:Transcript_3614/g.7392  ORF Transcript_3614/g.7392 Transcript_3614/m.7392 type:complete len:80 (-) Transcript_3614:909-1148(-)
MDLEIDQEQGIVFKKRLDHPWSPIVTRKIVEESHSTAALTKAGVHFGDCVSKDRDLCYLQESKKADKGLIFSFDDYIKC